MEFRDALVRRRMVRNYTDEPVDPEALARIVDAGVRSPSAGFSQGQRFVVVTDSRKRQLIADAAGEREYVEKGFDTWISRAPAHIVICADRDAYLKRYAEPDKADVSHAQASESGWKVPYWWVDAGASMMSILLASVDEGLAAGLVGAHSLEMLHEILEIPNDILIVGVVTIGHPSTDRRSGSLTRGWRNRDSVVFTERWGA